MMVSKYLRLWQILFQVALFSRLSVAFIWIYQGVIPKLVFKHPDEIQLIVSGGIGHAEAVNMLPYIGWGEVGFGILLLVMYKHVWPVLLSAFVMLPATFGVAFISPEFLVAAFNPLSLNFGVLALSVISGVSLWVIKKETLPF